MASEDVIELGSSDDETEPLPKKLKPMLDAMVHIPSKLPGITIKPSKSTLPPSKRVVSKPIILNKTLRGKPFTCTEIKPLYTPVRMPVINDLHDVNIKSIPLGQNKGTINPLHFAQNLHRRQVVLKKNPRSSRLKNTIPGANVLNTLPSSITIKPIRKCSLVKKKPQKDLSIFEIDDEDAPQCATASPRWYMRPEDQTYKEGLKKKSDFSSMEEESVKGSMEEKNNKEPDTTKYVEITIEDSPLKPVHSKHEDIGKELTITIEDSPVKPIVKAAKDDESDSDTNKVIEDKQSKKKLDYPKDSNASEESHVVEIEIDFKDTTAVSDSENKSAPVLPKHSEETEKSPKQKTDDVKVSSPKKNDIEQTKEIAIEDDEFHPTYHNFIDMCFQLENTNDMKKIVEKKIKAYYKQCPKDYVESEEFIDLVSSKISAMEAAPEKMYLYIKDIVDELNLQRKMTKSLVSNVKVLETEKEEPSIKYEEFQYNSKKRRKIRKLEKTIKKLHRAIQKLEEQEVDFDDDEDSVYLLTERYMERMVRVHAKFCLLTNTKMPSEPRILIEARPGRPTGPAKKLEKWINKKVPIGTPLPFPDFHDVLRCVRDANEESKLGWNDMDIQEEARDLFTRCGKKLQRRRQENEWRMAASRITTEVDPAEVNIDLKKKLDENKTMSAKKEREVFNKYVDRQNLLKLEAVEIGDKEAEESPLGSEEEEDVVESYNALEDKQKRKQRLKRLLKEKSKKDDGKENIVRKCSKEEENTNETKMNNKESKEAQEKDDKETSEDTSNNMVVESMPNNTETSTSEHKKEEGDTLKENKEDEDNDNDTYNVDSDIDELHLLQELHSEIEVNTSSSYESDSDTPIAISESDSDVENGVKLCDVVSIENSSYSESEMIIEGPSKDKDTNSLNKQNVELVTANFEIEYSSVGVGESNKQSPSAKKIRLDLEENILLASSDEETKDKTDSIEIENTCINLRDDNISISETTVDGEAVETISNDENSILAKNNAVEIIESNSLSSEVNYVTDNEKKEDTSKCAKSTDNTESICNDHSKT